MNGSLNGMINPDTLGFNSFTQTTHCSVLLEFDV